jgi:CRISPR-associated protein Cmr1
MRSFKPTNAKPQALGASANNNVTITYTLKLVTPMIGGGVQASDPDPKMPFRAKSIRGHLRFWWRVANHKLCPLELKERETKLFGGIDQVLNQGASLSAVRVKVETEHAPTLVDYHNDDSNMYVMFPLRVGNEDPPKKNISANTQCFKVLISAPKDFVDEIGRATLLWIYLGGIGARTRRGVGCLELIKAEGVIGAAQPQPSTDIYELLKSLELDQNLYQGPGTQLYDTAEKAWKHGIDVYKTFRQGTTTKQRKPRTKLQREGDSTRIRPEDARRPGKSTWPDADRTRQIQNRYLKIQKLDGTFKTHVPRGAIGSGSGFPRAWFGLPINFTFRNLDSFGNEEIKRINGKSRRSPETWIARDTNTVLNPVNSDRLASPIILKPIKVKNGKWIASLFELPGRRIKLQLLRVKLHNAGDAEIAWDSKPSNLAPRLKVGGIAHCDPISAFQAFFKLYA